MTDSSFNIKFDPDKGIRFDPKKSPLKRTGEKDFKKVLEEGEEGEKKKEGFEKEKIVEEKEINTYEEIVSQLEAYEQKPKKTGISLFQLAEPVKEVEEDLIIPIAPQEGIASEEDLPFTGLPNEVKEESLSALFHGYGSKEKGYLLKITSHDLLPTDSPIQPKEELSLLAPRKSPIVFPTTEMEHKGTEKNVIPLEIQDNPIEKNSVNPFATSEQPRVKETKEKFSPQFVQEQPDLFSINPLAATTPSNSPAPSAETKTVQHAGMTAEEIQELVDQIISKLYTIKTEGKTDTLITLKHPPLFEGAHLVIRSYDHAKGEFNLSFENLNLAAKRVLDRQENQDSLRWALEQRGFTVHILTITTLSENSSQILGGSTPQKEQGKEEGFKEKKQKQEQEKEPNRG